MAAERLKAEGNNHFKNGEFEAAIRSYSRAIELDLDNHVLYSNRSAAYAGLERWDEAAADGLKCVALCPTFVKGYHRASNALKNIHKFKDAISLIEKGLVHDPGNKDFVALLEELRALFGEEERRRRATLRGAEALKEEGNDLFKAAKFELAAAKYTEAFEACADKSSPVAVSILNNRAACYQQLSDFPHVVADTTYVLEHDENNIKALIRRALALEALEKYRTALADIRKVLSMDPSIEIANKAQHRIGDAVRRLKADGVHI